MEKINKSCLNCENNAGDVCLGYGTIPSDDGELDGCSYSLPIDYLTARLGFEACDEYAEKEKSETESD